MVTFTFVQEKSRSVAFRFTHRTLEHVFVCLYLAKTKESYSYVAGEVCTVLLVNTHCTSYSIRDILFFFVLDPTPPKNNLVFLSLDKPYNLLLIKWFTKHSFDVAQGRKYRASNEHQTHLVTIQCSLKMTSLLTIITPRRSVQPVACQNKIRWCSFLTRYLLTVRVCLVLTSLVFQLVNKPKIVKLK